MTASSTRCRLSTGGFSQRSPSGTVPTEYASSPSPGGTPWAIPATSADAACPAPAGYPVHVPGRPGPANDRTAARREPGNRLLDRLRATSCPGRRVMHTPTAFRQAAAGLPATAALILLTHNPGGDGARARSGPSSRSTTSTCRTGNFEEEASLGRRESHLVARLKRPDVRLPQNRPGLPAVPTDPEPGQVHIRLAHHGKLRVDPLGIPHTVHYSC
jgi:hypothetical protein